VRNREKLRFLGLLRRSYYLHDHLVGHRLGNKMPPKNITKVFNIAEWGLLCCRPLYNSIFSLVFVKNHMGQMTPNKSPSSACVNQSQSWSHSRNQAKWDLTFFSKNIFAPTSSNKYIIKIKWRIYKNHFDVYIGAFFFIHGKSKGIWIIKK